MYESIERSDEGEVVMRHLIEYIRYFTTTDAVQKQFLYSVQAMAWCCPVIYPFKVQVRFWYQLSQGAVNVHDILYHLMSRYFSNSSCSGNTLCQGMVHVQVTSYLQVLLIFRFKVISR